MVKFFYLLVKNPNTKFNINNVPEKLRPAVEALLKADEEK